MQHAGGDGGVGARFYQHKRSSQPVGCVAVVGQRLGRADAYFADVVHSQFGGFLRFECFEINPAFEAGHHSLHGLCTVLEEIFFPGRQRTRIHPTHAPGQLGTVPGQGVETDDGIAAADVEIVLQAQCHGLRTKGFLKRSVVGPDFLDATFLAARQYEHFLTHFHNATSNLAGQATEIV